MSKAKKSTAEVAALISSTKRRMEECTKSLQCRIIIWQTPWGVIDNRQRVIKNLLNHL
jgi:hypothetical protein